MAHVRDSILADIVARIDANATFTGATFKNRLQPIASDLQYAIVVRAVSEAVDYSQGMLDSQPQHVMTVAVDAYRKFAGSNDPFSDANDYLATIEGIMYDGTTLATLAQGVELGDFELEHDDSADIDTYRCTQNFIIYYYAREGAPETPII